MSLCDRFDVLVESKQELDAVVAAVERSPQASLALVQLLRHGDVRRERPELEVHEGLLAESLAYSVLQSGPQFLAWGAARGESKPREPDEGPAVVVEPDGDRLRLTLNRPSKRNAFGVEMRDALVEALRVVVYDPSIREVTLRGAGRAFCSGGDLDEFGTLPDPATAHVVRSTRHPARWLVACADRVTVHAHGACVGAGIELPAFAHRIVAREDAYFQLPEVAFGLVPGAGGTVSLPRRIGRQRTAWLALTSQRIDARTALRWGLVDEVVS
jgi:hypothetical protein